MFRLHGHKYVILYNINAGIYHYTDKNLQIVYSLHLINCQNFKKSGKFVTIQKYKKIHTVLPELKLDCHATQETNGKH